MRHGPPERTVSRARTVLGNMGLEAKLLLSHYIPFPMPDGVSREAARREVLAFQ